MKAVFWDRDGTLTDLVIRSDDTLGAPWILSDLKFKDGAVEACQTTNKSGYMNFVVTNQPDIEDEIISIEIHCEMNKKIIYNLAIDDILVAYNRKSIFYKPNNGLLEMAIRKHGITRHNSFMIGDSWRDILTGAKSSLTTIFIGHNDDYAKFSAQQMRILPKPNYYVDSALEAAKLIKEIDENIF